jgi:universal stress protein E
MSYDTIVIAIDFSETSIKAAKWAAETFAPTAAITLVHVVDPPDRPPFGRHLLPAPEVIEAEAREYGVEHLREVATFLTAAAPRCVIRVGKPHEEITRLAADVGADLIVVGPHGDRPRPTRFLGTTAERIVRTSPVSVLIGTNPPAGRPRHLLAPVDDSPITPTLLAQTRDLAETFDADVTLLHVWSNAVYIHVASMSYAAKANESEAREEIDHELRDAGLHWLRELARTGIDRERVDAVVTHGKAGDAALQAAATVRADFIILGRQGTGVIVPALLGSTVSTVLHGSMCPVLVVADPAAARASRSA